MKTLFALTLVLVLAMFVTSPVFGQAEVDSDKVVNGYFMDNYEKELQFRSAGASEFGFLGVILNTGWGCAYPSDISETDLSRFHNVLTPSENGNSSTGGPMLHIIWPTGSDPCIPSNWIAGGWGQFSSSWQHKEKKDSFAGRFTASGYFFDEAGICEGDYVAYSAIWHVAGPNDALDCDLNPFDPDVSGCDKVDEKVQLTCPDL